MSAHGVWSTETLVWGEGGGGGGRGGGWGVVLLLLASCHPALCGQHGHGGLGAKASSP